MMELDTPRFGGAAFACITVILLGIASAFFGVALSSELSSSAMSADTRNILSVDQASAKVQGPKRFDDVRLERTRPVDPWDANAR